MDKVVLNTGRKKINWILILQGWAMLWVVIGHSTIGSKDLWPEYARVLFKFAYSFHMALFMFTSGFLFFMTRLAVEKWTYKAIIIDKAKRLLIPGLVFFLVALGLKLAFPEEMTRKVELGAHELLRMVFFPYKNPFREMWFIAALLWMFVLTPIWKWTLGGNVRTIIMLMFLIPLHLYYPHHPYMGILSIGDLCNYAIWFFGGMLMSKSGIVNSIINRNMPWMPIAVGATLYAIGYLFNPFGMKAGGIIMSIGLSLVIDKYIPSMFKGFRNYTYQIFLMGIFCQFLVKIIYSHVHMPYLIAYLLCIVVGLYIPVLISKILEKTNNSFLLCCVGLKKRS